MDGNGLQKIARQADNQCKPDTAEKDPLAAVASGETNANLSCKPPTT